MNKQTFTFIDPQRIRIFVYCWTPKNETAAKGIVQIAHGMAETASRYEPFATVLTSAGYIVYANDHRGHGKTAACEANLGDIGPDGFNWMVRNMSQLTTLIREKYVQLPIYLFAHSMGSFLTQQYITEHAQLIQGVILCGSDGPRGLELWLGEGLAKWIANIRGPHHRSTLMDKLIFGRFNRKCIPNRTPYDWLSRDNNEVDTYMSDPYCAFLNTASFYWDLFKLLRHIHRANTMDCIPKKLPILLIAGTADPVSRCGKGVQKLARCYQHLRMEHIKCTLYPDARHELLHETNREQVMADCIIWLNRQVQNYE